MLRFAPALNIPLADIAEASCALIAPLPA
ncbi:hypothetical protein C210_11726 [Klebsiella pneumoniae subsp. pneumoniae KpMDU1]|nr:hypothetical protein C210_11726 [Klebsiella pneumoniae subsp. pneumoniae KpMDU1]